MRAPGRGGAAAPGPRLPLRAPPRPPRPLRPASPGSTAPPLRPPARGPRPRPAGPSRWGWGGGRSPWRRRRGRGLARAGGGDAAGRTFPGAGGGSAGGRGSPRRGARARSLGSGPARRCLPGVPRHCPRFRPVRGAVGLPAPADSQGRAVFPPKPCCFRGSLPNWKKKMAIPSERVTNYFSEESMHNKPVLCLRCLVSVLIAGSPAEFPRDPLAVPAPSPTLAALRTFPPDSVHHIFNALPFPVSTGHLCLNMQFSAHRSNFFFFKCVDSLTRVFQTEFLK